MNTRPILFSAPMVRAILAGTKTQTRRVVKPTRGRPIEFLGGGPRGGADWNNPECWGYEWADGPAFVTLKADPTDRETQQYPCPYGQPGDRLWVRETWMPDPPINDEWPSTEFHGTRHGDLSLIPECYRKPWHTLLRASWDGHELVGWRPSIHMPRWASRITLEITGLRVERLIEISQGDAIAEGIEQTEHGFWSTYGQADANGTYSPRASYRCLWEAINGAGSWESNPWVWVVEFRRVQGGAA